MITRAPRVCRSSNPVPAVCDDADFDGDGNIDDNDLTVFNSCLNSTGFAPSGSCSALTMQAFRVIHDGKVVEVNFKERKYGVQFPFAGQSSTKVYGAGLKRSFLLRGQMSS